MPNEEECIHTGSHSYMADDLSHDDEGGFSEY